MWHPIHPPTVHFPIACWIIATGVDMMSMAAANGSDELLWNFSALLLVIGCVMAVIAVTTGMIAVTKLPHKRSVRKAMIHAGLMGTAFLFFVASLFVRLDDSQGVMAPGVANLILECVGTLVLIAGGWIGGNLLTYSHGFGRDAKEARKNGGI